MKLEFLLVVVLICLSQGSPVLGRHLKKKDVSSKANKEVRSIVSAIVDAILDGDRKRRSEVVDFSEDEGDRLSKPLESEQKSKHENENGIQKHNVTERTLTFTKREDRDSDQGLRLANVIATSDVNATDNESETMKRNTIEHVANVTNTESQENDPEDDDSEPEEGESGTADEEKLSHSGSGFSEDKSEIARVRSESGGLTGLSDGAKKDAQPTETKNGLPHSEFGNGSDGAKKDAQPTETKNGSPHSEFGNGSGDDSDDDDNDDDDDDDDNEKNNLKIKSESNRTVSGSGRDASDDMDAESGSGHDDSENENSGDAMDKKALENNKNTGKENYRNNFPETVSNAANDENTSQKMDKDYVSEKSDGQGGAKNETGKLDKNQANWNKDGADTDTSASMVPLKSSKEGGEHLVSDEKQTNQSEQDETSTLASNQVSENFPGDIDKQENVYNNTSVDNDDGQGGSTEIVGTDGLGNLSENNMQFGLDETPDLGKDVEKGNPAMRRDQALVSSIDGNGGEFESNEKVPKQNKHGGSSNENESLVSPNFRENSQWQRKSEDTNIGRIENRNGNTSTMFDEVSRNLPNNGDKKIVSGSDLPIGNSMDLENINFEKEEKGVKKQFENLGNMAESEKQNSSVGGRELESQNLEKSVSPENRNFEENQVGLKEQSQLLGNRVGPADPHFEKNKFGFEKESGNLVDDKIKVEKQFGNLGNNIGVGNRNFGKDQRNFEKQLNKDSESLEKVNPPHTGSYRFQHNEPETGAVENLGNIAEDSRVNGDYQGQMANNRRYENNYYNIENNNPYRYQNSRVLLDKRNFIPKMNGFPKFPQPIKNNALDGLVGDVGEPWLKNFLTKTLEMAVNGDNAIKTPTQDAAKYSENIPTKSLQIDSEENNSETASKEMIKSQKDNMPSDATKSSDKDNVSSQEEDYADDDSKGNDDIDYDKSGDVRSRRIEEGKSSPLPVLNKKDRQNEVSSNNKIKYSQLPELTERPLSEILKYAHIQSPIAASPRVVTRIVPVPPFASTPISVPGPRVPAIGDASAPISVPKPRVSLAVPAIGDVSAPIIRIGPAPNVVPVKPEVPQLLVRPPNRPLVVVLQVPRAPGAKNTAQLGNITPGKAVSFPSSEKTGPLLPDKDSKEVNTKQGIVNELSDMIDNEIQNIGAFSNEKLESDSKEAQLSQMLKNAIPVESRRPKDIDNDIKEEIENLKDYASALTETAGLTPAHHDDLARKFANDLLDEMKVSDERKDELLEQLMAFVTSMEIATVRERLAEIRAQMFNFATKQSDDPTKIRAEAVRLLDEFLNILPLPKVEIEAKKKRLLESKLLNSLVSEAERRSLREKLKKALVDLVADKLL